MSGPGAIGRTIAFAKQNAVLVVNCAPFGCMPGTVTTAVFRQLSVELGMPIVNVFYDGTGGQNRTLAVFLKNALESVRERRVPPLTATAGGVRVRR